MDSIRVAIIGFGGIARSHNTAYVRLKEEGYPIELVAVCEKNAERVRQSVTTNLGGNDAPLDEKVRIYTDIDELIEKEDFDLADICLPTFLHKDFSVKLIRAGKHVLCEKPMALTSGDCREMLLEAEESGRVLMIGQCLRFEPAYLYLKRLVESGELGALKYLTMERFSIYPTWGSDFGSMERTGGCILDTHIHDIDIARFILGEPEEVSALWYNDLPHCQRVNSRLYYGDCCVIADCAWDEAREKVFEAGYRASFEGGGVVCELDRVTLYKKGEKPCEVRLDEGDRISGEIRAVTDEILERGDGGFYPPESAMASVKLIETLRKSAELGGIRLAADGNEV